MSRSNVEKTFPHRTAVVIAQDVQGLFSGTASRWAWAGWIARKQRKGPRQIVHVCIPRAGAGSTGNAVWDLVPSLLASNQLAGPAPDPEHVALELVDRRGWSHQIICTSEWSWGYRLVEAIGPAGYFRMLKHRLELAGTFKLHRGHVCIFTAAMKWEPIKVADERTFFWLARTKMKPPAERFERAREHWEKGLEPEYIPAGHRAIANPDKQPWLFCSPLPPRVRSKHAKFPKAHLRAAPRPFQPSRPRRRSSGEVREDPGFNPRVCL